MLTKAIQVCPRDLTYFVDIIFMFVLRFILSVTTLFFINVTCVGLTS